MKGDSGQTVPKICVRARTRASASPSRGPGAVRRQVPGCLSQINSPSRNFVSSEQTPCSTSNNKYIPLSRTHKFSEAFPKPGGSVCPTTGHTGCYWFLSQVTNYCWVGSLSDWGSSQPAKGAEEELRMVPSCRAGRH